MNQKNTGTVMLRVTPETRDLIKQLAGNVSIAEFLENALKYLMSDKRGVAESLGDKLTIADLLVVINELRNDFKDYRTRAQTVLTFAVDSYTHRMEDIVELKESVDSFLTTYVANNRQELPNDFLTWYDWRAASADKITKELSFLLAELRNLSNSMKVEEINQTPLEISVPSEDMGDTASDTRANNFDDTTG